MRALQVIVETATRNYTAGEAPQLLDDLGLEQQVPRCCYLLTAPLASPC